MHTEKILKALLEAAAGVTTLVGSRIYADEIPEGDPLPAVVMLPISDTPEPPFDATAGSEPCSARVQVMCVAATQLGARELREAVRIACHLKSGPYGGVTALSVLQDITGPLNWDHAAGIADQSIDFTVRYLR